jgi:hypothetical protein
VNEFLKLMDAKVKISVKFDKETIWFIQESIKLYSLNIVLAVE